MTPGQSPATSGSRLFHCPRAAMAAFSLLLLVLLSPAVSRTNAWAGDSEDSEDPPRLALFFSAGVTAESSTQSTFTLDTGSQVQALSSHDDLSRFFEAELDYRVASFFSIAPVFQGVSYNRADGGPNDKELSLLLVPRFQTGDTGLTFWAGFGVGETATLLGSGSFSGTGLNYDLNRTALGLALSPRAGMDYIMDGYDLGLEVTYTTTQASFPGTATDPVVGRTDPVTEQLSRGWWGIAMRVGFQL